MNYKIIILTIIIIGANIFAQSKFSGRFGFGVGYVSTLSFYELNSLNDMIKGTKYPKIDNKFMYLHSITGNAYILALKNVRFGFQYSFGQMSVTTKDINDYKISIKDGFGGPTFEYSFSISHFNVSIGTGLFYGRNDVIFSSIVNTINFKNLFDTTNLNHSINLSKSYYSIYPMVNIEYSISRFIAFRLGGSYGFRFGGNWKYEDKEVNGISDNLVKNNFNISAGLLIGFYSR